MAIGEVFLGAALQVIFEKVLCAMAPEVRKFMKRVKGIQPRTVKELEHQLRRIETVLIDAEQKQIHSLAVKLWLQDLRDLFYDLEDLLDELAAEAQLHQMMKLDPQFWIYQQSQLSGEFRSTKFKFARWIMENCGSTVKRLTSNIKHCRDFSLRIKEISGCLQNILGQVEVLKLAQNLVQCQTLSSSVGTNNNPSWRESTSILCEPTVYGRDNEKREIISQLLKDEPSYGNFVVYSIVGKGGIGKTTLAQSIYNDEQLKDGHFELKGWVCVSDVFDTKRITTTILNSITKGSYEFSNLNQAQESLRDVIRHKRFLIVLDDVWSDEYADWDSLQIPFREGARGSRLIATTRSQNVACTMNPRPNSRTLIHGLSNEDCWNIFRRHAFEDPEIEMTPNFAAMKNDILRKCKGLPLAAKALGGLLRAKFDESEWQQILSNNIWSTEDSQVCKVLKLSYHYLPSHLKPCFAYCAIFPKDYEFTEEFLILLWMAQGLLPEKATQRMEDIGHDHFSALVSRSFFEPGSHSYQHFKMHDLINDLAQWAAGDVNMEMDCQSITKDGNKDYNKIRHISFQGTLAINSLPILIKINHLRTLFSFGKVALSVRTPLLIPKNIRVLSLAKMYHFRLPDSIGFLKLLRYLDLSFHRLGELPESICSLCNLQTLVLRYCKHLQKLPQNMKYLVKLRHLDINDTPRLKEMPQGIGNLTNLQMLNKFVVGHGHGHTIRELRSLNCLHKSLTITGLENVVSDEDACDARLYEKSSLDELQLQSEPFAVEVDDKVQTSVFEQLRPPKCIRKCILKRYRAVTLPNWLGLEDPYFTRMIVIKLESCHRCESLPSLGKLPSLKELYLKDMDGIKCIDPEFYGSSCRSSFPALKILSFNNMKAWEEWLHPNSGTGEFPCLEELWIEDCPSLQGSLPCNLPQLQGLIIHACNRFSVSLPILPMLRILSITRCKRLSSTTVVCSSKLIVLYSISEFQGLKGLWVEGLHRLCIDDDHAFIQLTEMTWNEEPIMHLVECGNLDSLWPSDFGELDNLAEVSIGNCPKLIPFLKKNLPSTIKRMRFLNMESGEYITRLIGLSAACLETLAIMYSKKPICFELPIHLHGFHSLGELTIKRCSLIRGFPRGGLPRNLKLLTIINVGIERPIHEWGLHHLCCLEQLTIVGCNSFHWSESFPEDGLLPSSLTRLIISEHLNLRFMSLSTVPNLVHLVLDDCPKLESFVDNWLPPGIQFLRIHGCPLLKEQCERDPLRQTLLRIPHFTFLLQIGNMRRQKWLYDLMLPASAKQ